MNFTFCNVLIAATFLLTTTEAPTQILIGSLASGEPELRLNDAELNTRLAFTLGGTTLQNAVLYSGSDVHGVYYYVRADGVQTGQNAKTRVAVILSQQGGNLVFDAETGCVLECIPKEPGAICNLNIRERCKEQSCISTNGGGCNVRVVFPSTPD
ncbi:MAG: hypothetical protein JNJ90_06910 [Saprospiraceae bacterium]|jgi:hypothetical protein|nr:hypothetical protein [Saprospiraceae bacterium]